MPRICSGCNGVGTFCWDFADDYGSYNISGSCTSCGFVSNCDETDFSPIVSCDCVVYKDGELIHRDECNLIENDDNREISNFGEDFRATYNRPVFMYERLSQSFGKEPRIPDDDMAEIKNCFNLLCDSNPFFKANANRKDIIDKNLVGTLLGFVDKKDKSKWSVNKRDPKKIDKRYYRQHYLEKWITIMTEVFGREIEKYSQEEYAKVGHLVERFSLAWDTIQNNRNRKKRKLKEEDRIDWKFTERKHIPYMNCLFRLAHKIYGIDEKYDKYWPLPKSEITRTRVNVYIKEIFKIATKHPFEKLHFKKELKQQKITDLKIVVFKI